MWISRRTDYATRALLALALDAGADDVLTTDDGHEVRCEIHAFDKVAHVLEAKGLKPAHAEIAHIPTTTVPVTDPATAQALEKLHDALDELDDVQEVHSNFDIPDPIMQSLEVG